MKVFHKIVLSVATFAVILLSLVYQAGAAAPGPKLSESFPPHTKGVNKHNLSYNNNSPLVKYRAFNSDNRSTQVCIFCHTPHSANVEGQAPLWNRKFSTETFQRYSSDTLQIRSISAANYGEPNGSSRLCLSCHDGVSRLGNLYTGTEIVMVGGAVTGVIEGFASFKPDTNKMKTGHHPVSFVYNDSVLASIKAYLPKIDYTLPTVAEVKLDKQSRMQCTTCHDPHQNQSNDAECYPQSGSGNVSCDATNNRKISPFWVYGVPGTSTAGADQQAVCLACHPISELPFALLPLTTPWTPN